jgi:hypothetical protein
MSRHRNGWLPTAGLVAALLGCSTLGARPAWSWGHTGHVNISTAAILSLPAEVPAFVRTATAARMIGELGAEADVSKSSGDATTPNSDIHDFERDPGHFIDLDDNGNVLGFTNLPLSGLLAPGSGRRDFDTSVRAASNSAHTQYDGYLPYNMVDQWQQVRKDFAYIRAFTAAVNNPATSAIDRSYFEYELSVRQTLTLRDIGYWSHFVADASQPLHVSVHFNGWGNFPNPNNFTQQPIHARFEGAFVKKFTTINDILGEMGPYVPCNCAGIEGRVKSYLAATFSQVVPLYQTAGTDLYQTAQPTEIDFVVTRLAAGATELRDEIVDAWRSSDTISIGFPLIKVADVESGAVALTKDKFAGD